MPSINGVPPIYVIPGGKTLFESLTASLISGLMLEDGYLARNADEVWWSRPAPVIVQQSKKGNQADYRQLIQVGYLHGLTFPARKVRIHPEQLNMVCSRSGQTSQWNIRTMAFRMGESLFDEMFWRDPFVAYRIPVKKQDSGSKGKSTKRKGKEKPTPIRPTQNRGKLAWREFTGLFLQQKDSQTLRPRFLNQLSILSINSETFENYPFRCVGFQTDGKMKFFEWFDFGFDVPLSLLRDPDGAKRTEEALSFATNCATTITSIFSIMFGHKTKNAERFKRLRERLETDYWSVLASEFREFVLKLGDPIKQQQTLDKWFDMAIREAQKAFEGAADDTGDDGNTMRQIVQGKARCWKQLNILRSKTK